MKTYTKTFKESYSFSRELQILTDLNQKLISVPTVLSANHQSLSITMSDAGIQINQFLRTYRVDLIQLQRLVYECLHTAVLTAKAGVYHLDLAPRNFLVDATFQSKSKTSKAITLIDFSVCVSKNFPLQKPLWLKPDSKIHHPALVDSLNADWRLFFNTINQCSPDNFEVEFSVSEADYGNYWGKRFNVELIDLNDVVLSFGIYRCLQEILNSWDGPTAEVRRLNEVLAPLQFCKTNEEANSAVKECLAELDATNNLYDVYSSATPTSLECTPVPTLFGSNNNERDLIFVTAPKERNQIEKTSGKVTSLYYRTLLTLVLVFPSLLSFFILDIAYKTLNIPLDTFGLGMVALSSISLCVMSLLILFFKPSKSSITAFFVVANASHLPLIYEVFLVELSLAGQLASALPVVAGLLVGIGIIYRRP